MRHAAGQLSERIELLGFGELPLYLLELELRLAPLRDVTGDLGKADQPAAFVDRVDDDARPEEAAILADAPAFFFIAALFSRDPQRASGLAVDAVGFGIETGKMLAEDFVRGIPLDALAADVPACDDSVGIEHVERVVGDSLNQKAETALAFEQVPLLLLVLSHQILPRSGETRDPPVCSSHTGVSFARPFDPARRGDLASASSPHQALVQIAGSAPRAGNVAESWASISALSITDQTRLIFPPSYS